MSLYVVLFPSEAKDNTGIKDLNDKVLGYQLNTKYIRRRQQELSETLLAARRQVHACRTRLQDGIHLDG